MHGKRDGRDLRVNLVGHIEIDFVHIAVDLIFPTAIVIANVFPIFDRLAFGQTQCLGKRIGIAAKSKKHIGLCRLVDVVVGKPTIQPNQHTGLADAAVVMVNDTIEKATTKYNVANLLNVMMRTNSKAHVNLPHNQTNTASDTSGSIAVIWLTKTAQNICKATKFFFRTNGPLSSRGIIERAIFGHRSNRIDSPDVIQINVGCSHLFITHLTPLSVAAITFPGHGNFIGANSASANVASLPVRKFVCRSNVGLSKGAAILSPKNGGAHRIAAPDISTARLFRDLLKISFGVFSGKRKIHWHLLIIATIIE
jgi:hypothetical protein